MQNRGRSGVKAFRPHILVVAALALVVMTGWHDVFRNALADLRFRIVQREASGDIVIVAIDAPSIKKIGVWPWPRTLHAGLIGQLEKAGVSDIAFDVDFSAASDQTSDAKFLEGLRDASGSVILPVFQQSTSDPAYPSRLQLDRPLKPFAEQSWPALVNVPIDSDGRVRRYPWGEDMGSEYLPSMSAMLAGQMSEKAPPFLIDFGIQTSSLTVVSYFDVLSGGAATLAKLKGKKAIVGGTAIELGDRFAVPNGRILSGPVLQALAAESILQKRTLHWSSDFVALFQIASLCLLMIAAWRRVGPGGRVIILLGAAALTEVGALLLQARWPLVLDTSLLHTATVAYLAAIALDEIDFRGLLGLVAERRFHRIAMSLGEGLVCSDQERQITFWNPGAEAIFGYSAAEMIGRPMGTIFAEVAEKVDHILDPPPMTNFHASGGSVVEFEGRRKGGEAFMAEACISVWHGADGLQYGAIVRDISVRKREAERIRYLAEYDPLTGLANRNTLQSGLAAMIASEESSIDGVALLVLGIDGFMNINDLLGHAAGDRVLQAVAQRLKEEAGENGLVARLSGDEFAIAVPRRALSFPIHELADRIVEAFERPLTADSREHRVKISTGIAIYPENGRNSEELLSNGHLAFCRAKGPRRGGHVMFDNSMRQELEARVTLEAELRQAVERNEFELFYQPQVHLENGRLSGAEALIRWRHPERGLVPPVQFMPVVNSSSISDSIAAWVLLTACTQARQWELSGHPIRVGVNLSPSQLQSGDLSKSVADVLQRTGLTPGLLELEVTEDILLGDEDRVLDTFARIQKLGVRLVFDDFGTGFASLSYLKKFPLDGLKIDRSFVRDLLIQSDDAAIVSSTIGLSEQLGLSVIAEGIEDQSTADVLARMGCLEGQGYFFGKPMPVSDLNRVWLQLDAA